MKKLVSSSEAAHILGLSLQGIHYRIKKGQLESIKQDGKIFVYVDKENSPQGKLPSKTAPIKTTVNDYRKLEEKILESKDDQIRLLKKTIKFMKRQYTSEISRLDKTQTQMLGVFQSEVDLLKSAFNEMRTIYKVEHKEPIKVVEKVVEKKENPPSKEESKFMDIKEFFIFMKNHNKTNSQIKNIILEKVKIQDKRFIYDKNTKEILIYKSDFFDVI